MYNDTTIIILVYYIVEKTIYAGQLLKVVYHIPILLRPPFSKLRHIVFIFNPFFHMCRLTILLNFP